MVYWLGAKNLPACLPFLNRLVYYEIMPADTKLTLLRAGRAILAQQGYHHTGIQEVLARAGVPKGSFYHFFVSKREFCLQILEQEAIAQRHQLRKYLADRTLSPIERLRHYFQGKCDSFANEGYREGCLLANLGQELADQDEGFRLRVEQFFADWQKDLASCLAEAQALGEIATDVAIDQLAEYLLVSWQGAILRMKTAKHTAPLQAFMMCTFDRLLTANSSKES